MNEKQKIESRPRASGNCRWVVRWWFVVLVSTMRLTGDEFGPPKTPIRRYESFAAPLSWVSTS